MDTPGATSVTMAAGANGMAGCLQTLNTQNKWGVGMVATSVNPFNTPAPGTDNGWRFIKVNGVAPTLFNTASGKYDVYTESTMFWQTNTAGSPTGLAINALQEMSSGLANPTVISLVNAGDSGQTYGSWFGGFIAQAINPLNATPTYPLSVLGVNANPVMITSRSLNGPNSCQPPTGVWSISIENP